jgi:hypothetical protein
MGGWGYIVFHIKRKEANQRGLNTKRPTIVFFFGSNETSPIIWIGKRSTVLVQSREMTGS